MAVTDPLREAAGEPDLEVVGAMPIMLVLPEALRELVVGSFELRSYGFGEYVVRQGDDGDAFYVVIDGLLRVVIESPEGETTVDMMRTGESFGEVALLDGSSRTASVRVAEPATVARLDRGVFQSLVRLHPQLVEAFEVQRRGRRLQAFLRTREPFAGLPPSLVGGLLAAAREVRVAAGERLVTAGERAEHWWVVQDGRLTVFDEREGRRNLRFLRTGEIFGEMALVQDGVRSASIEATSDCTLIQFDRERFEDLLEDERFRARIDERIAMYAHASAVPLDFAEFAGADERDAALASLPVASGDSLSAEAQAAVAAGVELADAAAESEAPWRAPRKFPHLRQIDAADCGPTCLAMICRAFGHKVSHNAIRHAVGTKQDGTSLRGLQRGGAEIGLELTALKSSVSRLESLPLPAVLHWEGNHWVVLYKVAGDRVYLADPARSLRVIDRAELEQKWSGFVATARPTERLADAPRERLDIRWLWPFLVKEKTRLLVAFVVAICVSGLELVPPVVSKDIVNSVQLHQGAAHVNLLVGIMFGLLVSALVASMVQRRLLARASVSIDSDALDHLTGKLLGLPLSYFQDRKTADIERRISGLRQLREIAVGSVPTALSAVIQLVLTLFIMIKFSWVIGLAFLATTPFYALLVVISSKRMRPTINVLEEAYSRHAAKQGDAIRGIEAVKTGGGETAMRARILAEFQSLKHQVYRADFQMMSLGAVSQLVGVLMYLVFVWISALLVLDGTLTIGDMLAVNSLVLMANQPVGTLLSLWNQMQMGSVLVQRVQDVLEADDEQTEPAHTLKPVPTLGGRVTLHGLGLVYRDNPDMAALSDISFDLAPGTSLGLVGRSGSGKSTLLRCLAGLLVPTSGTIEFDGVDLRELRWNELRQRIGFVIQAPYLFDDSIASNIALGNPAPDMDRVVRAAELAAAAEFISELPMGYATRVGDSGVRLSGGQSQRIQIARALYNDPPIVLFDEATSALDSESERAVKENLDGVMAERTSVIVAHRLSTVRDCDVIGVLDRGRMVEWGSHEELMARQGLYFHLNAVQLAS